MGVSPLRWRAAVTIIEVMVVIAIMSLLMGLLLSATQQVRVAAARAECLSNLRNLGIALHQYEAINDVLPPGSGPAQGLNEPQSWDRSYFPMSWHTRILPFLEQSALWEEADTGYRLSPQWDENPPHTGQLKVVSVFLCPAESRPLYQGHWALTSYLGISGTRTLARNGVLFRGSPVSSVRIRDGTSSTIVVGERPPNPATRWYGTWQEAGTHMGVRDSVTPGDCIAGPPRFGYGSPEPKCADYSFWSRHGSGANVLAADGSVRFLTPGIENRLLALSTREGGEVIGEGWD